MNYHFLRPKRRQIWFSHITVFKNSASINTLNKEYIGVEKTVLISAPPFSRIPNSDFACLDTRGTVQKLWSLVMLQQAHL